MVGGFRLRAGKIICARGPGPLQCLSGRSAELQISVSVLTLQDIKRAHCRAGCHVYGRCCTPQYLLVSPGLPARTRIPTPPNPRRPRRRRRSVDNWEWDNASERVPRGGPARVLCTETVSTRSHREQGETRGKSTQLRNLIRSRSQFRPDKLPSIRCI